MKRRILQFSQHYTTDTFKKKLMKANLYDAPRTRLHGDVKPTTEMLEYNMTSLRSKKRILAIN